MAPRLFLPADELLVQYARRHRDQRNIATHRVGAPLIVIGVGVLLARVQFDAADVLTLAWAAWALTALWYMTRGSLLLGLAVSLGNAVLIALAHWLAAGGIAPWLGWGLGCLAVGWAIEFVGHYYEGHRPFGDDLLGLLVGPMFVAAEALFALGLAHSLAAEVERRAGPTVLRDLAHPVG